MEAKSGGSGAMVFVTVRHEISAADAIAIMEEQDIAYREAPNAAGREPPKPSEPRASEWTRKVTPDPAQLFRYSALTFNGHRIHYHRNYAHGVECYPGLVVHGPYTATLLADHFCAIARMRVCASSHSGRGGRCSTLTLSKLRGRKTKDGAQLWA
jgi:3-methylfumaryl-CoA hydratase